MAGAAMNPPGAWDVFAPYSGTHALALVVCALLIAAPSLAGRRLQKNAEAILRRTLAALAVCYRLAYNMWWNWNGLDLRTGLPLQICDFNGLVAPLALMTGWRWARAALYFWTSALTLQAFIQPALTAGPALLVFWAFWAAHTIIAACAVYDIAVLGFRPGWNDLGRALAASAVYVVLVVPITGWMFANASGDEASFFGLLNLPHLAEKDIPLRDFVFMLHKDGQYIVLGLLTLHVAGALRHHFLKRDDVLRRMLPRRGSPIAG